MKLFNINICKATLAVLAGGLLLVGCVSQPKGPGDSYRASREANNAVAAWNEEHDYHRAVAGLENTLDDYEGDSFEQSVLTALALVHMEYGNHDALLETAGRLEATVDRREYVPQQTQHVLFVAAAMKEQSRSELPGRGYDSAHGRSVYTLLEAGE